MPTTKTQRAQRFIRAKTDIRSDAWKRSRTRVTHPSDGFHQTKPCARRAGSTFQVPGSKLRHQRYPRNPRLNENYETNPAHGTLVPPFGFGVLRRFRVSGSKFRRKHFKLARCSILPFNAS